MPIAFRKAEVGSLTHWFADNEFVIYREFIQASIADKSKAESDAWLDTLMAGGCQQEFEAWLQANYPDELEMYNIVRFK